MEHTRTRGLTDQGVDLRVELDFTKMHGTGNDFILVDDRAEELDLSADSISKLCDRHFGIGADGVLLVRPSRDEASDFFMVYYNSDGTTAEMCGNGVRCFAKYVFDRGLVSDTRGDLVVGTLGGLKPVKTTLDHDGTMHMATVNMGVPVLRPADIPTELRCGEEDEYVVNCELETESEALVVTCVSMGNPHAVTWVEDLDSAPVDVLGPLVETDKAFPNRTNVEFATVLGEERLGVRVWERGVGETLACGTGACATLVAATLTCRAGREASIELPGGELHVRWNAEDDCVYLTGPAEEVFSGTIEVLEEDS